MSRKKKPKIPKPKNPVVQALIANPRRNTCHGDQRKEESKNKCREPVNEND